MATLTFVNELTEAVQVFDSWNSGHKSTDPTASVYGTLTDIGSVPAAGRADLTIVDHGADAFVSFIPFRAGNHPVGHYYIDLSEGIDHIDITAEKAKQVQDCADFLDYLSAHPGNDDAKEFLGLARARKVGEVNAFFKRSSSFKDCTWASYILALADRAKNPPPPNAPPPPPSQQTYSLAVLCSALGGTWPAPLPDVSVRDFSCTNSDGVLTLVGIIDLSRFPFAPPPIDSYIASFLHLTDVRVSFTFDHALGLNLFGTSIRFVADDFHIPVGGGTTVTLSRPTVQLSVAPIFRFFVFTASASIPFNVLGRSFVADISFVIDNVEAEIGGVVRGDASSLQAPAPMRGVNLDAFGVGIGIIFAPPAFALGLEGTFHIGGGGKPPIATDNYVVVCAMEGGEFPTPLYIAFNVPEMDLPTLAEVFTDQRIPLDAPVQFRGLSFQWAANPMEPVILPDGTLTQMAFGCSAFMDLFGLRFYGLIDLSLNGIETTLAMDPLRFGRVLGLTGAGRGVSLKVDPQGNPWNNAQVPKTAAARKAIAESPTRQFIAPGGPEVRISTSSSPYLSITADVTFLDVARQGVTATVGSSGISFELDCGSILIGRMSCVLADYHNFTGAMVFGFNNVTRVTLPVISGFPLGHIGRIWDIRVTVALLTSPSEVTFTVSARFTFADQDCSVGPYRESVDIGSLRGLLEGVITRIADESDRLFGSLTRDATRWASLVRTSAIKGAGDVATGLRQVFHCGIGTASQVLKDAGYAKDDAIHLVKSAYGASAGQMVDAIRVWTGDAPQAVASVLHSLQYPADESARALLGLVQNDPKVLKSVLEGAMFPADQIKGTFDGLGGDFARLVDPVSDAVNTVKDAGQTGVDDTRRVGGEAVHKVEDMTRDIGDAIGGIF